MRPQKIREPLGSLVCGGIPYRNANGWFARLPLTSKLDALCAANVNSSHEVRCSRIRHIDPKPEREPRGSLSVFGRCVEILTPGLRYQKRFLYVICTQLFTYSPYIPLKRPIFDQCFRYFRTENSVDGQRCGRSVFQSPREALDLRWISFKIPSPIGTTPLLSAQVL